MSQKTQHHEITRRRFLYGLAVVGGSAAVAACSPGTPAPAQVPTEKPAAPVAPKATEAPKAASPTAAPVAPKATSKYNEAPALTELVKAGKLPPVDQRLPLEPMVVKGLEGMGKYGGTLRGVHTNPDVFEGWLAIGMDQLAAIGPDNQSFIPNLATKWEINDSDAANKVCTVYLRKGARWSNGQPFTADDIVFWWDDLQMNKEFNPAGITADSPIQKVEKIFVRFSAEIVRIMSLFIT